MGPTVFSVAAGLQLKMQVQKYIHVWEVPNAEVKWGKLCSLMPHEVRYTLAEAQLPCKRATSWITCGVSGCHWAAYRCGLALPLGGCWKALDYAFKGT